MLIVARGSGLYHVDLCRARLGRRLRVADVGVVPGFEDGCHVVHATVIVELVG